MAANEPNPSTLDLSVSGMTCGSCVRHVAEALRAVDGVSGAEVDLRGGRATVAYDPAVAASDRLVAAVEAAGYRAEVAGERRPAGLPVSCGCGSSCCA